MSATQVLALALPFDPEADGPATLRFIADRIAHAVQAGELVTEDQALLREIEAYPMALLRVAGDQVAERQERRYGRCCMCGGETL